MVFTLLWNLAKCFLVPKPTCQQNNKNRPQTSLRVKPWIQTTQSQSCAWGVTFYNTCSLSELLLESSVGYCDWIGGIFATGSQFFLKKISRFHTHEPAHSKSAAEPPRAAAALMSSWTKHTDEMKGFDYSEATWYITWQNHLLFRLNVYILRHILNLS